MTTHNWDWYVTNHALDNDARMGKLYFLAMDDGEALPSDKLKALSTDNLQALMTWAPAQQTWTYASSTTVYAAGNVAGIYSKGMKVKLTQTTTKYFYITNVSSYDAGNNRTTLTLYGGSGYSVANATVSSPFYSCAAVAIGFPEWISFTPTWTNLSLGNGTQVAKVRVAGNGLAQVTVNLIYGSTTSISGSVSFAEPIPNSGYGTAGSVVVGRGMYTDWGSAIYEGSLILYPAFNIIELRVGNAAGTYMTAVNVNATVPFTWAVTGSPDQFSLSAQYMI